MSIGGYQVLFKNRPDNGTAKILIQPAKVPAVNCAGHQADVGCMLPCNKPACLCESLSMKQLSL